MRCHHQKHTLAATASDLMKLFARRDTTTAVIVRLGNFHPVHARRLRNSLCVYWIFHAAVSSNAAVICCASFVASFCARAPSLSAAKGDAQGGHDSCGGECEAAKAHRYQRCKFSPGVDVILDHDLQPKRGVIEEGDQKQDHENAGERRSQPSDEGGVIAAGMRDDRGDDVSPLP